MTSNIILPEKKVQILAALASGKYSAATLAREFNISKTSIYTMYRELIAKEEESQIEKSRGAKDDFIELSLSEGDDILKCSLNTPEKSKVAKASLIFEDFSLTIEGRINSCQLFEAIKILELKNTHSSSLARPILDKPSC